MTKVDKQKLFGELKHIADGTRQFKPPCIPSRYLQDLANSDPAELIYKYVLAKKPRTALPVSGRRSAST